MTIGALKLIYYFNADVHVLYLIACLAFFKTF